MVTLKTILNKKVDYQFCQVIVYFCYNEKWIPVRNIRYLKNDEPFYQKLSLPPREKANDAYGGRDSQVENYWGGGGTRAKQPPAGSTTATLF